MQVFFESLKNFLEILPIFYYNWLNCFFCLHQVLSLLLLHLALFQRLLGQRNYKLFIMRLLGHYIQPPPQKAISILFFINHFWALFFVFVFHFISIFQKINLWFFCIFFFGCYRVKKRRNIQKLSIENSLYWA